MFMTKFYNKLQIFLILPVVPLIEEALCWIVTFLLVKGLKVEVADSIVGMEKDILFPWKHSVIITMLLFYFHHSSFFCPNKQCERGIELFELQSEGDECSLTKKEVRDG